MKQISLTLARVEDSFDRALDRLTTYRLVLYLLILYMGLGVVLSFAHKVPFSPRQIIISVLWLVLVSRLANKLLAWFLKVPANQESDLITGLILALILTPLTVNSDYLVLAAAAILAMVSKYLITFKGRHILNPAAAGAFSVGIFFHSYASWWVGNRYMLPLVAIGGLLIAKKMKRLQMVMVFGAVFVAYLMANAPAEALAHTVWTGLINGPLLFFATVMLTEPLTSPTNLDQCLVYALAVGALFSIRNFHLAPEGALLIGNGLTFLMSPNRSLKLRYVGAKEEANEIYSFMFRAPKKLAFSPGQYMEWTLPGVRLDSRGNRRYLTIASSPTEDQVAFSVRMPHQRSGYKSALASLSPGQEILAGQLAGDFTLPEDPRLKLAFIAGGIGITPFRSMVRYLLDNNDRRDTHLIYSVNEPSQLAFRDLFEKARPAGLKPHYIVSRQVSGWQGLSGPLDRQMLENLIPDWPQRIFYISGPQGFVASVRKALLEMGVSYSKITTDFFPGYN